MSKGRAQAEEKMSVEVNRIARMTYYSYKKVVFKIANLSEYIGLPILTTLVVL